MPRVTKAELQHEVQSLKRRNWWLGAEGTSKDAALQREQQQRALENESWSKRLDFVELQRSIETPYGAGSNVEIVFQTAHATEPRRLYATSEKLQEQSSHFRDLLSSGFQEGEKSVSYCLDIEREGREDKEGGMEVDGDGSNGEDDTNSNLKHFHRVKVVDPALFGVYKAYLYYLQTGQIVFRPPTWWADARLANPIKWQPFGDAANTWCKEEDIKRFPNCNAMDLYKFGLFVGNEKLQKTCLVKLEFAFVSYPDRLLDEIFGETSSLYPQYKALLMDLVRRCWGKLVDVEKQIERQVNNAVCGKDMALQIMSHLCLELAKGRN